MKLDFAMPVVGSIVGSAARAIDEAITDAFAMFPTLDQMLDLASQVVVRRSNHGKA